MEAFALDKDQQIMGTEDGSCNTFVPTACCEHPFDDRHVASRSSILQCVVAPSSCIRTGEEETLDDI